MNSTAASWVCRRSRSAARIRPRRIGAVDPGRSARRRISLLKYCRAPFKAIPSLYLRGGRRTMKLTHEELEFLSAWAREEWEPACYQLPSHRLQLAHRVP